MTRPEPEGRFVPEPPDLERLSLIQIGLLIGLGILVSIGIAFDAFQLAHQLGMIR